MTQMVPSVLRRVGWKWTTAGLEATAQTSRGVMTVLIPLRDVEITFRTELMKAGAPLGPSVGAAGSTSGFLASVGRAQMMCAPPPTVGRASTAERRAKRQKRKERRKKFFRGIARGIKKVGKGIAKVAKAVIKNPVFKAAFSAISTVVPVLAPAAAGLAVASKVIEKIDKGKKALDTLKRRKRRIGAATRSQLMREVEEARAMQTAIGEMRHLASQGDKQAQKVMGELLSARAITL